MTIRSKGACANCRGRHPEALNRIGETVILEDSIGRGVDRSEHTFSQCPSCGSLWVELEDSGAGGHGRFMRRLTEGLF